MTQLGMLDFSKNFCPPKLIKLEGAGLNKLVFCNLRFKFSRYLSMLSVTYMIHYQLGIQ